ncbi:flagellar protein FlgN [Isachenkonia alkalipeptolytica]|uniref:Flagellar protein FlgN n=1 Tax=Isachenkonia alkalipeptolytica TaxID=2565777 RepID=A0AA43XKZ7_9CLOT|nr:flagellar protein FlgN [Isachenkonia alkalipeptolytica]NBG88306.1 flagellar protein FlgN [Isachenkonia alkalipeptolytica]
MAKSLEQLKASLIKEKEMYDGVLKLSKEKQDLIVKGKVKEIEALTQKEQVFIKHMGTFEKIRRSIFTNASKELNIREVDNVSELLLFIDEEEGKEIDGLRDEILDTIKALKEVNEENESLIKKSLEYIDFNKELIASIQQEGPQNNDYTEKASERSKSNKSILDMKI